MSRSSSLRIRDVRAVDALVSECEERWSDPVAWKTHLLAGASTLMNLPVGLHAELTGFDPGQSVRLLAPPVEHGWPDERLRRAFLDSPGRGTEPFGVSPVDLGFREVFGRRRGATRLRSDLIGDAAWRDQAVYHEYHRPAEMDEIAYSAIRLPRTDTVSLLAIGGRGHKPGGRERRILALLHHEVTRRIGVRLATHDDVGPHRLSDSQRVVYDLLLSGLDEKAISRRLRRTRSTISGHVMAIYKAFAVESRAEFLAYHIARRPRPARTP